MRFDRSRTLTDDDSQNLFFFKFMICIAAVGYPEINRVQLQQKEII